MDDIVEHLPVISQNGERLLIKRVTVHASGAPATGDMAVTRVRAYLPDGTEVEELANGEFVDRASDTFYKPI